MPSGLAARAIRPEPHADRFAKSAVPDAVLPILTPVPGPILQDCRTQPNLNVIPTNIVEPAASCGAGRLGGLRGAQNR